MTKVVTDPEYIELSNVVLNELKDAINFIAAREGKNPEELIPHYPAFLSKETVLVKESLEKK